MFGSAVTSALLPFTPFPLHNHHQMDSIVASHVLVFIHLLPIRIPFFHGRTHRRPYAPNHSLYMCASFPHCSFNPSVILLSHLRRLSHTSPFVSLGLPSSLSHIPLAQNHVEILQFSQLHRLPLECRISLSLSLVVHSSPLMSTPYFITTYYLELEYLIEKEVNGMVNVIP